MEFCQSGIVGTLPNNHTFHNKLIVTSFCDISENNEPFLTLPMPATSKVTAAVWGPLEKYIITGHEKGELIAWDVKVIDNRYSCMHTCLFQLS